MSKYYSESLSGDRLKKCYDLASPRVKQYLEEEINFVRERIKPSYLVLELGCGYRRVLNELKTESVYLFGIDNSIQNLNFGTNTFLNSNDFFLFCMDAQNLGFHDNKFDLVYCIQNGISAFIIEPNVLIDEALRVTKPGGKLLLSSYSDKFWDDRLEWFEIQSKHKLIGEINYDLSGEGKIVCKDGFKATTYNPAQFEQLLSGIEREYKIFEIDESSIFCEVVA